VSTPKVILVVSDTPRAICLSQEVSPYLIVHFFVPDLVHNHDKVTLSLRSALSTLLGASQWGGTTVGTSLRRRNHLSDAFPGYNWVIIQPAELSAAAVLISYWTDINGAAWIAILIVAVVGINMLGARGVSPSYSLVSALVAD
jgi:hypothetical protein